MVGEMLKKELIEIDLDVKDQEEFFDYISAKLYEKGYVKDTFQNAIKTREANYPTALPVDPYPVAIPHAEIENIIHPFIAAVRLKNPVEWCEMANNDVVHQVRFIFVLGFLRSDAHIDLLQLLVKCFQDDDFMEKLVEAKTIEDYESACLSIEPVK